MLMFANESVYGAISAIAFIDPAAAQVVIPHGDFDTDFERYLVAAVTFAALVFAMWRYFKKGR
jgi:hypothetical protein